MRRARPNSQGTLDGLCGLYALVHFLRELRDHEGKFVFGDYGHEETLKPPSPYDRSRDAFWYVLDVAQRLGILSPDYVLHGYPAGQLVRIFNSLRDDLGLDYTAVHFSDLAKLGKKHSFRTLTKCIFDDPRSNAVLVQWEGHYYLSKGFIGDALSVEDSAVEADRREKLATSIVEQVRLSYCAAIIENSSALVRALKQEVRSQCLEQ